MIVYVLGSSTRYALQALLRQFFGPVQNWKGEGVEALTCSGPEWIWVLEDCERKDLGIWALPEGSTPPQNQDELQKAMRHAVPLWDLEKTKRLLAPYTPQGLEWPPFYRSAREVIRQLYCVLCEQTGRVFPWGSLTGIRPTSIATELLQQGYSPAITCEILQRYFAVTEHKARLVLQTAQEEQTILGRLPQDSLALYVHIPFCPSRCTYCSFSTQEGIGRTEADWDQYLHALAREIRYTAQAKHWAPISVLYVGGGTPGVLRARQIRYLASVLRDNFRFTEHTSWTFEAGRPDQVEKEQLQALRECGFGQICINPQTFHQKTLDLVQRKHRVEDCITAYEQARAIGFDSINMDLIIGLPGEEPEDMLHSLQEMERLAPDSFTLHSLAIKRASLLDAQIRTQGDPLALHRRQEALEQIHEQAEACAKRLGLVPYYMYRQKNAVGGLENLGYARPGQGNPYNLAMMGDGLSVLGFGAGAMSKRVQGSLLERACNVRALHLYLQNAEEMAKRKLALWECI